MRTFVYDQPAIRVIFGVGVIDRLPEEMQRLGARRALVLASPGQRPIAEAAARRLGTAAAGVYAEAAVHVPIDTARAVCETAKRLEADCCVTIGGEIGMPADGFDRAARLAADNPYHNPRTIDYASIRQLLEDAYRGTRPV